jgi:fructose-1,6-bisphosphatase/inositol monophosphatase family enzyme
LGKYAGFLCPLADPWDFAPAYIFTKKMGGLVTDFQGNPWTLNSKQILGSLNPAMHAELLNITKKHWTVPS